MRIHIEPTTAPGFGPAAPHEALAEAAEQLHKVLDGMAHGSEPDPEVVIGIMQALYWIHDADRVVDALLDEHTELRRKVATQ